MDKGLEREAIAEQLFDDEDVSILGGDLGFLDY